MNYYHPYPYGTMPHSMNSGYRYQPSNPMMPTGTGAPLSASTSGSAAIQEFLNNTTRGAGNYIDHILNYNKGQIVKVQMTFNSGGASAETRVFTGYISAAARDHIILIDSKNGHRYVLLTIYLDFIEFPEEINYYYPGTNILNVVDENFFDEHPEVLPIYNYQNASKEAFLKNLVAATPSTTTGPTIQPY